LLDDPSDGENGRRFLETSWRQTTRMERLVTDLLRLARLDARQETLDRTACDIAQLCETVVADLAQPIEAKGQRVTIVVPDHVSHVSADPMKLHDVVRNLVENAVNYSPEQAEVRLEAAHADGTATIAVSDSGP